MFNKRPYALIVDRDEDSRARVTASLRESGFVVAAFRESRGALAALAAHPVDIAVIAGQLAEGEVALAAARQMRHCRPGCKVLFAGAADALPAAPGPDDGRAATQPVDKRRFLSAVFELLGRDGDAARRPCDRRGFLGAVSGPRGPAGAPAGGRDEAELGLMAARLACLRSRQT